ncbi:hypothetical protein EB796_009997 [Bugula neritina]|uniref:Ig-like domain-containing protein n=1 Tax=Bugula neritina TaxID=10212 RepID=A0A7J7K0I2_BUGNE|nr:hypothetical protein EB796_009997 [Bugula neritina]
MSKPKVEVWLFGFLISQLLVLGVTALENVYYDMADITTTATFNAESKTYDISPTTPFNITCFYVNADFTYEYAEVKWSSGSPTSFSYIFNNGQTEPGFQASPWRIPQNSPENGSVSLTVDQLPSSYYSNSDSPKIWFKCEVLTVNRDIDDNLIQSHISHSIEISIVVPLQFVDGETDLTVNEGSDVELTCEVTGHPAPRFQWVRKDGLALPLSANREWTTVYRDMADIKATVPFNQQSQKYEIQADSPFNVTCFYENVNTSLTHAKVQWTAVSQNDLFLLHFNGETFPGIKALPNRIPSTQDLSNGVITLLVDSVLPIYQHSNFAAKITYRCSVITVAVKSDGNYLETHTNRSLEISVSIPMSTTTQEPAEQFIVKQNITSLLKVQASLIFFLASLASFI